MTPDDRDLPVPADPTAEPRIVITREGLRDGSLLADARRRMPPGVRLLSEAEIQADLDARLMEHRNAQDVWLFGYGSLMWNPAIDYAEHRAGVVRGWHRRFCLWLHMGRGSPDNPGLMLALDRGGSCAGMLFRIPAAQARSELLLAWRRELFTGAYRSRWVTASTEHGPVRAATFVVNRAHPRLRGPAGRAGGGRTPRIGFGRTRQLRGLPVVDSGGTAPSGPARPPPGTPATVRAGFPLNAAGAEKLKVRQPPTFRRFTAPCPLLSGGAAREPLLRGTVALAWAIHEFRLALRFGIADRNSGGGATALVTRRGERSPASHGLLRGTPYVRATCCQEFPPASRGWRAFARHDVVRIRVANLRTLY